MAEPSENKEGDEGAFVIMPFDPRLQYRDEVKKEKGGKTGRLKTRWEKIVEVLSRKIETPEELIQAHVDLLTTTSKNPHDQFFGLQLFFKKHFSKEESQEFFTDLLPKIQQLALSMPDIVPHQIPILHQGVEGQVTLSKHAVAALMAGAFFCLFPPQSYEKEHFPTFSFAGLYGIVWATGGYPDHQAHKLKCHLNYFRRVLKRTPKGNITFVRRVLQEKVDWNASNTPLRGVEVHAEGIIEDADGALHADFANQFLGGGALEGGCVQEEIMFTVQNELCAGMLFCTTMNKKEAILMIGSEQYSEYKGYGGNFEYVGNFRCHKERDEQGRKKNYVVAIDALDFRMQDSSFQFKAIAKKRELNKAYIGFLPTSEEKERAAESGGIAPIATGNWGGGAFRGDRPLKAVLQWLAASEAGRDTLYYSFKQADVTDPFAKLVKTLRQREVTVGQCYRALRAWDNTSAKDLFKYLMDTCK
eukprot:TRINITY_DN10533_c0_g1_i1.p1 TRINITY_DN10533_c0_g1~~TRINITY_DN10533_c0_g1_i1.p1  ORF type:complete len:473 (+),score=82.03 TRINITY_DN10533_c0_g1_i1:356-1774(+)